MKLKVIIMVLCLALAVPMVGTASPLAMEEMFRYTHTSSVSATLSIVKGVAKASGRVVPIDDQRTSIVVRLQRENGSGTWSTICTWSDNNDGGNSEAGGGKNVTSGYNYRTFVTGKVYNDAGAVVETVNKYSGVKFY